MGARSRWFRLLVFLKQCAVWMISQQPSNVNGAVVGLCFWQMKCRRDLSDSKIKNSNWEPKAQIQVFPQKEFSFYKTKMIMDLCVSLINHQGLRSPFLEAVTIVSIWTIHHFFLMVVSYSLLSLLLLLMFPTSV